MTEPTCAFTGCHRQRRAQSPFCKPCVRWMTQNPGQDPATRPFRLRGVHTTCTVPDCGGPHAGKGYCSRHHHAWRKYGDPLAAREPDAQRSAELRALISQSAATRDRSACWLDWPGVHLFGYPKLHNDKVSHLVLTADGHPRPEPPSDHACHSCDTPACWNPGHLRWDTNGANRQDSVERERHARGEGHGHAKLTEAGVREIRRQGASGRNRNRIAAEFRVSRGTVNDILRRQTWAWLTD